MSRTRDEGIVGSAPFVVAGAGAPPPASSMAVLTASVVVPDAALRAEEGDELAGGGALRQLRPDLAGADEERHHPALELAAGEAAVDDVIGARLEERDARLHVLRRCDDEHRRDAARCHRCGARRSRRRRRGLRQRRDPGAWRAWPRRRRPGSSRSRRRARRRRSAASSSVRSSGLRAQIRIGLGGMRTSSGGLQVAASIRCRPGAVRQAASGAAILRRAPPHRGGVIHCDPSHLSAASRSARCRRRNPRERRTTHRCAVTNSCFCFGPTWRTTSSRPRSRRSPAPSSTPVAASARSRRGASAASPTTSATIARPATS